MLTIYNDVKFLTEQIIFHFKYKHSYQYNANKFLQKKKIIKNWFADKVPYNSEILREMYSLCHRLPVLSTARFGDEFYNVSLNLILILKNNHCRKIPGEIIRIGDEFYNVSSDVKHVFISMNLYNFEGKINRKMSEQ